MIWMKDQPAAEDRQAAGNGVFGFPQEVGNQRVGGSFSHSRTTPATPGYSHGSRAGGPVEAEMGRESPTSVQRTKSSSDGRSFMELGQGIEPRNVMAPERKARDPMRSPPRMVAASPSQVAAASPGQCSGYRWLPAHPNQAQMMPFRVDLQGRFECSPVIKEAVDVVKPLGGHTVVGGLQVDAFAEIRLYCGGHHVTSLRSRLLYHSRRGLARATHAGHRRQRAQGIAHINVFKLFSLAPRISIQPWSAERLDAMFRRGDFQFALEILSGQGMGMWPAIRHGARRDQFAAAHARARAQIQNVIGAADGFLVVLDDQDGIAQVAQTFQGLEQARVVALVQADARLVQNVEDADQAGADLGGQADALGLAAAQGAAFPVQGQVAQADILQEGQPGADFLDQFRARSCAGILSTAKMRRNRPRARWTARKHP